MIGKSETPLKSRYYRTGEARINYYSTRKKQRNRAQILQKYNGILKDFWEFEKAKKALF